MFPSLSKSLLLLAASALPLASAERIIESKSLNPCLANSSFAATLFHVTFTPDNRSLTFNIQGVSNIATNVSAEMELLVYGYSAMKQDLNPCDTEGLEGMCPMNSGNLGPLRSNIDIPPDVMAQIPGKGALCDAHLATFANSCRHRLHHSRSGCHRSHQNLRQEHKAASCLC